MPIMGFISKDLGNGIGGQAEFPLRCFISDEKLPKMEDPRAFELKEFPLESNSKCVPVKSAPSVKCLLFKHEDLKFIPRAQG